MFKRTFTVAVLCFLFFTFAVHAQTPPSAGQVTTTANLRGGPGTAFPIVGSLTRGATVEITGCNDDCTWYQVGEDQWIAAFLVTPTETTATPIAGTAPEPITLISWNVESGGALQAAVAERLASFEDVDIFGLSEVSAIDAEAFEFGAEEGEDVDYDSLLGTTGRADRLLLIWDASRFEQVDSGELLTIGETGRAPLWVQLRDLETSEEVIVMVNHLHRSNEGIRHRQGTALNAWAAGQTLPVIALGDYNFDWNLPNGDADHDAGYDNLTKDGVWEWVRPAELVTTQCSGWPCGYNSVLDFVFAAGPAQAWNITSEIIVVANDFPDDLTTPDHRPVLAVIVPNGAAAVPAPTGAVTNTVLLVPTATPAGVPTRAPTATPVSTCPQTTGTANVRSGPGTNYSVAGSLRAAECVVIIGRTGAGDWYQLSNGNWIAEFLVINVDPLASIPVTFTAPAPTATIVSAPIVDPVPTQPAPQPTAVPTAVPTSPPAGPVCDSNYTGACIPQVGYDLNCGDISERRFQSVGSDPHNFDGDSDGLACES